MGYRILSQNSSPTPSAISPVISTERGSDEPGDTLGKPEPRWEEQLGSDVVGFDGGA
jgi:hypothetical protein